MAKRNTAPSQACADGIFADLNYATENGEQTAAFRLVATPPDRLHYSWQRCGQLPGCRGHVNQAASGSIVQAEASLSRVVFFPTL
jgi:hypothetical protein